MSRGWAGTRAPILVGAGAVLGAVALRLRDPHVPGSWGRCPVSLVLGIDCPGCGALRAVDLLTHGDVVAAASSNLLLVVALPLALLGWAAWLVRARRGALRRQVPTPVTALVVGLVVVTTAAFTVTRNLPAGAWLHS